MSHILVILLFAAFIALMDAVGAKTLTVGSLPPSAFVDTEVSTNIPINVIRNDVRVFEVQLDFRGTASNCVPTVVEKVYDWTFSPLEKEEWEVGCEN